MSQLAKIPPGVGPKHSQVVVLVGATGDLSRRKLLPGLFHLSCAGFIPGCRIVGVSLDEIDADGFRKIAREALDQFSSRKIKEADWTAFAETLDYVPIAGGAPRLSKRRLKKPRAEIGRRKPALALSERAAQRRALGRPLAGGSRSCRTLPHHHGEAVRHRPGERGVAERKVARGFRRGPDLPDRPLSRQGAGAEHPRLPLRQWLVRADLEPQFHRSRPDRRSGEARARQARRVLRGDRRLSRHGGDPPVPDPCLHGDGAADIAWSRCRSARKRTKSFAACCRSSPRMSCAANIRAIAPKTASIRSRTPRPSSR